MKRKKKKNQKRKNGKKQVSTFPLPPLIHSLSHTPTLQFDFLGNGIWETFLELLILCQWIGICSLRNMPFWYASIFIENVKNLLKCFFLNLELPHAGISWWFLMMEFLGGSIHPSRVLLKYHLINSKIFPRC